MKELFIAATFLLTCAIMRAIDNPGITSPELVSGNFTLIQDGIPTAIFFDSDDDKGISLAVENLAQDFERVAGKRPAMIAAPKGDRIIIVGSLKNPVIKQLCEIGVIDKSQLEGATEKYLMTAATNPLPGVDEALVIAGSDRRGTIYGIYELSEQIGVSPWYWWADVPVVRSANLSVKKGQYTAGEPAVRYRGLFLNDEAPCLTGWVKDYFGTNYGGVEFYEKVFELLLRLRGNYLWPAMWSWSFYADDPRNSDLADEMGVIMGTSHHEPMARNHQEWARHRDEYGVWDYAKNKKVIDKFFSDGVRRIADKEDIITIGMRGDGDAPMGGEEGKDHEYKSRDLENLRLLTSVIDNQRKIIRKETGEAPEKHPQLWALYKEVQKYYDMGLRVPDDVIILLADDNWGNIRKVPTEEERDRKGGWGMYYHVDYVGAPRNSKWLNVTPVQNMWEQLNLAYEYGIDKLWILNVGDLKPMEYPITLFMDMAWNPAGYDASNLQEHVEDFCLRQFGPDQAKEAARILNLYSKYNGRVTPEMLDASTYNLAEGEWRQVRDEYLTLETEALRQYLSLPEQYKDAYKQLVLFPVQAMANLYDMYYSQAMNRKCYDAGDPMCNFWADRVEATFKRDAELMHDYNNVMSGGKWRHMMDQKHIGYRSWNDSFPADKMPDVKRMGEESASAMGGYTFDAEHGVVSMEAEHFFSAKDASESKWTVIPDMGRTLSAITLMPRIPSTDGASVTYRMNIADAPDSAVVHVILRSTQPFKRAEGHRFTIGFDGAEPVEVNYNSRMTEDPENVYTVMYPTAAARVIDSATTLALPNDNGSQLQLTISPIDPGMVIEKVVVDLGGYADTRLFMPESPFSRK